MRNRMSREEELKRLFEGADDVKDIVMPLIDEVIFLEGRLDELKKLPFIRINPEDSSMQKPTTASKLYKEFLQQYNNCIKTLISALKKSTGEEESPLREFFKRYGDK